MTTSAAAAVASSATMSNEDTPTSLPHSPHAMAEAVLAEAVAAKQRQEQQQHSKRDRNDSSGVDAAGSKSDDTSSCQKRIRLSDSEESSNKKDVDDASLMDQLKAIWASSADEEEPPTIRTIAFLHKHIDSFLQAGLEAFYTCDEKTRELAQVKEDLSTKDRELQRLRASEEQSRVTITNLLRAVETSKSETRDASRRVEVEAKLRAEVTALRGERNEALASAAGSSRQVELLQEELRTLKQKHHKLSQEKIKLERDSRAAISLARSLDSHASSDVEFYKRKASELSSHLQTQQALVAEQKHQMDEMRRQMERSMSQNRLSNLRAESNGKQQQGRNRTSG